jgi:hypothetical protein
MAVQSLNLDLKTRLFQNIKIYKTTKFGVDEILLFNYKEVYIGIVTTKDGVVGIKLVHSPRASLGRNQRPVRRPVWLWYSASWASS